MTEKAPTAASTVSFASDFDGDLHMFSQDPDTGTWRVLVIAKDLKEYERKVSHQFIGCYWRLGRGEVTQMAKQQPVSVETLKAITDAFNAHDMDAIMEFFAEDCSLDMPRGPDPWGKRLTGKAAVREGLATRFKGLPDVHYGDDRHWVSGNLGVSEWLLTGTTPAGVRVQVRGCDHWEFRDGKVIRKDSYWKIVEK
jgi:ketosteroid isomerase-like protein